MKYQTFQIESQLESIMGISTKLFICFLIATGIHCTGACVRKHFSQIKNSSTLHFFSSKLFISWLYRMDMELN